MNNDNLKHFLKGLVEIDTYTENKAGVNKGQYYVQKYIASSGYLQNNGDGGLKLWKKLESKTRGDLLIYRKKATSHSSNIKRIILSGHIDTVFPKLYSNFEEKNGKWFAPGINDMKGGVAVMLLGLEQYLQKNSENNLDIYVFIMPSEEEGSKDYIKELTKIYQTKNFQLGLVFEGGGLNNGICVARKGGFWFDVIFTGIASHAGYIPAQNLQEKATNAIIKAAKFIDLVKNCKFPEDVTLNPGVISGGTKPNVVPENCKITYDCRFEKPESFAVVKKLIREIAEQQHGEIIDLLEVSPLVASKEQQKYLTLFDIAAQAMHLNLIRESRGGGSDGGLISSLGIPVIDGLGAIGFGAHSGKEYILPGQTRERIQLFEKFLELLAQEID